MAKTWLAFCAALVVLAAGPAHAEERFVRTQTQYIAALGSPDASAGEDAHTWGLWEVDPGPRGVWISNYDALIADRDAPMIRVGSENWPARWRW